MSDSTTAPGSAPPSISASSSSTSAIDHNDAVITDGRYAGLIKKKGKGRLAQLREKRVKSNSTSTLYVSETLQSPDINGLLMSIAVTLHKYIVDGHTLPEKKFFEIFDESEHPLTHEDVNVTDAPDQGAVFRFLESIFDAEKLSAECGIMMLAYIDRIIESSRITLHASNWRRITLSTLILASKVWEDQAVWNVDFLSVFPNVSVKDLGELEKVLLRLLQYNVSLKASVYAKYYFELRSLAEGNEKNFPIAPLDRDGAARLESLSQATEERLLAERPIKRSRSMDEFPQKSPQVVLN